MIKFCHHLTKPIIARIIVSLVFKNIIVRAAVLFSEIYDFGYIGTNFVII